MLREIDNLKSKGAKPAEFASAVKEMQKKYNFRVDSPDAAVKADSIRRDQVSHHILRLAYCNSEDKRKWFLAQETALFRARFEGQTAEQRARFCERERLKFVEVRRMCSQYCRGRSHL